MQAFPPVQQIFLYTTPLLHAHFISVFQNRYFTDPITMSFQSDFWDEALVDCTYWTVFSDIILVVLLVGYFRLAFKHGTEQAFVELWRHIYQSFNFLIMFPFLVCKLVFGFLIWLKDRAEDQHVNYKLHQRIKALERELRDKDSQIESVNTLQSKLHTVQEEKTAIWEAYNKYWTRSRLFEMFPRLKPTNWDRQQETFKKNYGRSSEQNAMCTECPRLKKKIQQLSRDHQTTLDSMAVSRKHQEEEHEKKLQECKRVDDENRHGWLNAHLNHVYYLEQVQYYESMMKKRVNEQQMARMKAESERRAMEKRSEAYKSATEAA